MPGEQAGSLAELARVELEIEGEGELLQPRETALPDRLVEEIPPALVPRPGGFVVQDLPDAAKARALREIAEDGRQVRVLERCAGNHGVVAGRRGELFADPPCLGDASLGVARPVLLDVADAHGLDEGAPGEIEAFDGQIRFEARPVVERVAIGGEELTRVMAGSRLRGDVPQMEVRVPELHVRDGGRFQGSGSRRLAAAGFPGPGRSPGLLRRNAVSRRRLARCPCCRPRTDPSAPGAPSRGSGPCGCRTCPCARR